MFAEQNGNPKLTALGVDQSISTTQSGGNMEGKEVRFGAAACGMFAGVDHRHVDRRGQLHARLVHAARRAWRRWLHMMLGEISPGGVGVGLMGILIIALLAVFIAGLMVGRTPEYLGKKIQAPEMKLVTLYILAMPFALLTFAAASVVLKSADDVPGRAARAVRGALQLRLDGQQQRLGVRLPGHRARSGTRRPRASRC